jgi:hypothetical protein
VGSEGGRYKEGGKRDDAEIKRCEEVLLVRLVLPLNVFVLYRPMLPLDVCLFYGSLVLLLDVSVYKNLVLHLDVYVYKSPCCTCACLSTRTKPMLYL